MIVLVNFLAALAVLQPAFHYEELPAGLEIHGSADGFSLYTQQSQVKSLPKQSVGNRAVCFWIKNFLLGHWAGLLPCCVQWDRRHLLHQTPHVQPPRWAQRPPRAHVDIPIYAGKRIQIPKLQGSRLQPLGQSDQVRVFTICDRLRRRDGSDSLTVLVETSDPSNKS